MKTRKKDIKEIVRSKYDQIAAQNKEQNQSSCCGGADCCSDKDYSVFSDDYSHVRGYNEEADLGLGCGIPSDYEKKKKGETVLDLGSGAGNDCFVARSFVGEEGFVYGIDFSDEMFRKAKQNTKKLGYQNIEFIRGDIENMPFNENKIDKVLSNCVLNLVPGKEKAFKEIFRVLNQNGSFCISDVVIVGQLPDSVIKDAELYAGCVAGAIQKDNYIKTIEKAGFSNIQIHKEKEIILPDEMLSNYLNEKELKSFKHSGTGIYSITVSGKKS